MKKSSMRRLLLVSLLLLLFSGCATRVVLIPESEIIHRHKIIVHPHQNSYWYSHWNYEYHVTVVIPQYSTPHRTPMTKPPMNRRDPERPIRRESGNRR